MDKNGICPRCQASWQGEDIFTALKDLDANRFLTDKEVTKLAEHYGYSHHAPKYFTNVNIHQLVHDITEVHGEVLYECTKCNHVFDAYSDVEYESMFQAKRDHPYIAPEDKKEDFEEEFTEEFEREFLEEGEEDGDKFDGNDENLIDP